VPLRRRHVDARGDGRPRAHRPEIATELGTDSLAYLSLAGVYEAIRGSRDTHCDACFSGEYPLEREDDANGKFAFEAELPLVRA
jgi:amidophosphoribosyltransferase